MSIAGRKTLVDSSLNNASIYHMSVYLLPKTTTEALDKIRRTFFSQGGGAKKKYHLIKWEIIYKSKRKGGLGIKNIRRMNISLLCKWWWKLEKEEGLWQEIVKYKYLKNKSIHEVGHRLNDSPIWTDLLKVKDIYLQGREVSIRSANMSRFWLDSWLYEEPLCVIEPVLFALCEKKTITVEQAVRDDNITSRRRLHKDIRVKWEKYGQMS